MDSLEDQVRGALQVRRKEEYVTLLQQEENKDLFYNIIRKASASLIETFTSAMGEPDLFDEQDKAELDAELEALLDSQIKPMMRSEQFIEETAEQMAGSAYANTALIDTKLKEVYALVDNGDDKTISSLEENMAVFLGHTKKTVKENIDYNNHIITYLTTIAKEKGVQEATKTEHLYEAIRDYFPTREKYDAYLLSQKEKVNAVVDELEKVFAQENTELALAGTAVIDTLKSMIEESPEVKLSLNYDASLADKVYGPKH